MATYNAILIGQDFVGGSENVQVTEGNGTNTLNQLLASTGNEPLIIKSLDIFSDNIDQVLQPIELLRKDPTGNQKAVIKIPNLSRYQLNNTIKGLKADDMKFDEDTYINYNILPGAFVKLTLNIDKGARKTLSYTKLLDEYCGPDGYFDVIKEIGYREQEEIPAWNGLPDNEFREREETEAIPFLTADGSSQKLLFDSRKNQKNIPILVGTASFLIAAAFLANSTGKGIKLFKL